jgi:glutaredoxin
MADDLQAMLVAKNTENSVIVYSKTTCPYCSEVKSLLGGLGVAAKVVELNELADGPAVQAALQQLTGRRTVPQVFIGGALVGACDGELHPVDLPQRAVHPPSLAFTHCCAATERRPAGALPLLQTPPRRTGAASWRSCCRAWASR